MDKSFLSQAPVIEASRDFVCIRLATYESKQEAEFLATIYKGRSGEIENTTFAILDPTGKQKLCRTGRGPHHAYRSARGMAAGMKEIAAKYMKKKTPIQHKQLPLAKSIDLGLNIASCDSLPMVVTFSAEPNALKTLNEKMLPVAWDQKVAGQFVYATTSVRKDLKPLTGLKDSTAIAIVQPDNFGLYGEVVAQFDATIAPEKLRAELVRIAAGNKVVWKNRQAHTSMGIQLGIDWKTEIPETDQQSLRAKERIRNGR